jgi:hypothetical protein
MSHIESPRSVGPAQGRSYFAIAVIAAICLLIGILLGGASVFVMLTDRGKDLLSGRDPALEATVDVLLLEGGSSLMGESKPVKDLTPYRAMLKQRDILVEAVCSLESELYRKNEPVDFEGDEEEIRMLVRQDMSEGWPDWDSVEGDYGKLADLILGKLTVKETEGEGVLRITYQGSSKRWAQIVLNAIVHDFLQRISEDEERELKKQRLNAHFGELDDKVHELTEEYVEMRRISSSFQDSDVLRERLSRLEMDLAELDDEIIIINSMRNTAQERLDSLEEEEGETASRREELIAVLDAYQLDYDKNCAARDATEGMIGPTETDMREILLQELEQEQVFAELTRRKEEREDLLSQIYALEESQIKAGVRGKVLRMSE